MYSIYTADGRMVPVTSADMGCGEAVHQYPEWVYNENYLDFVSLKRFPKVFREFGDR